MKRGTLARQILVKQVGHAPFGPITGWTYGNGRRLERPHDLDYRISAVSDASTGGLKLGFNYDAVGALTQLKNGASGSVLANYVYDGMGRLLQVADAAGMPTHTYGWDATGNRLQAGSDAGTLAYHYPATSHRLSSVGGQSRVYDAAGNTTQRDGRTYAYNSAGRLGQAKQGATVLGTYRYNHRGERVLRQAGTTTTTTLYDESGQWLGEYSAAGQPLQQVVWLENYPIAVFSESSAGVPALGYVQPGHLGAPRVIVDATRNVPVWEWTLTGEAFGADGANEDPDGDGVEFQFALRFPGQQATAETGLNYNYQRDYDAGVGRYVQSDPIGLAAGNSTYSYAAGNPSRHSDPQGLQAYSGQLPPPNIPGGPWRPAPGQPAGTFYGPPNGADRNVCRYVPDAKNGGPQSATNGAYWKAKAPGDKGWPNRYRLNGVWVTAQQAHPGPRQIPSWLPLAGATSGWGVIAFLATYSAPLGGSEQQTVDIRNDNAELP